MVRTKFKRVRSVNGWFYGEKKKKTNQGSGRHTKFGKSKGSIKKYRGQGGTKSRKV